MNSRHIGSVSDTHLDVYKRQAPAVGRQRAGEEQLAVLRLDAVFRQRGERRLADVEHALDKRPLLAGADEVAVAARAAEQQQRVEDDEMCIRDRSINAR